MRIAGYTGVSDEPNDAAALEKLSLERMDRNLEATALKLKPL